MSKIESLPFFHGTSEGKNNGGFPHILPIDIYFDNELKMFRCRASDTLVETLNQVYMQGSLVDGSISSESGNIYVSRLVDFIINMCNLTEHSRTLEIGFGKGVVLKGLKEKGFQNLIGIEPGNHDLLPEMDDIEFINDFFPSEKINEKLDVIYHFAVWEHVDDPIAFIRDQISNLNESGSIVFGVPNCEPYVEHGDLSMFLHEHYSYFTSESISNVVKKAGGVLRHIQVIEGMLVGKIVAASNEKNTPHWSIDSKVNPTTFWKNVENVNESLRLFFNKFPTDGDVAVYVPGRALNTLFLQGYKGIRMVDDNSEMRTRYLPYFDSPVESFEDLCKNPPSALLIYSTTFGKKIKEKCLEDNRLSETLVVTLDEIS